jgi:predicted small lipoprotein YifL
MKTYLRTAVLAVAIATLCACGAKGPLFMPEEDAPLEMPPDEAEVGPLGAADINMEVDTVEAGPAAEVDADADDATEAEEAEEAEETEETDPTPFDDGA